jgi:hypothetical protein
MAVALAWSLMLILQVSAGGLLLVMVVVLPLLVLIRMITYDFHFDFQ